MSSKFFAGCVLLVSLAGALNVSSAPLLQHKVFIIAVDGTMTQSLAVAQTPNLNALKLGGVFSDRAVTAPVTHSAACYASLFTGAWGDKTLITRGDNTMTPNRFDLYPNFMRRLEAVNSNWNTVAYIRWEGITNGNFLEGVDLVQRFGSDSALVDSACNRLTNGNPDVFFTILLEVDSAGHANGETGWGTTNYVHTIEVSDGYIGRMMNALTHRATYTNEDWLVIILSDHGRHDSTTGLSRMTFHLVWGQDAARGWAYPTPSIVDVCATALNHMGVAVDPAWNLDCRIEGRPLPPTHYGTNLTFNGDGECNSATNNYQPDRGIAWWWDFCGTTLGRYGSHSNFPKSDSPGPANRGNNFFLGGTNRNTFISQTINISDIAGDIDDPGVDFQFSGWLGGAGSISNNALFSVSFLSASNTVLGTNYIGPVTALDRGGVTGMLERSTNGTLPAGTRLVEFTLRLTSANANNDASADNLSFMLTPRPDSPFNIVSCGWSNETWQVEIDSRTNRLYTLERSPDLQAWASVGPAAPGTGARMTLPETAAPAETTFYRVRCERP